MEHQTTGNVAVAIQARQHAVLFNGVSRLYQVGTATRVKTTIKMIAVDMLDPNDGAYANIVATWYDGGGSVLGVQSVKELVDVEHAVFQTAWDVPAGAVTLQVEADVNDPNTNIFGDRIHLDAMDAIRDLSDKLCGDMQIDCDTNPDDPTFACPDGSWPACSCVIKEVDAGSGLYHCTQIRECQCVGGGGGTQVPTLQGSSSDWGKKD